MKFVKSAFTVLIRIDTDALCQDHLHTFYEAFLISNSRNQMIH
ncbi:MAG: hypothetical protein SPF56_02975 [Bacteroidaceae bacterium]|nr:hypothetical protein [Bacteroidaceae bacterium]